MSFRPLKNSKGYMAVFIAIVFQVLFVFFAMVINIGLFVHDKINLQNSVDLAAYYAAGKQAEVLNAVAHSNYQIRQSWKLLSWRIRVLGDMAAKGHPLLAGPQDRFNPALARDVAIPSRYPQVCVAHSWWDFKDNNKQNFCRTQIGEALRAPDPPRVVNPFFPLNFAVETLVSRIRDQFNNECDAVGGRNFQQAIRWMGSYKTDIANRVQVINAYSKSLTESDADFLDVLGDSAAAGAQKTLEKNLTRANLQNVDFKMYNSLGHPAAQNSAWLNKVAVLPRVYYTDTTNSGSSCGPVTKPCSVAPRAEDTQANRDLARAVCSEPQDINNPSHSTIGFEKNPWIMAYVGVEAVVKGRRPFAPFGGPVEIRARAFAKPFGGTIGPWFRTEWQPGSPSSNSGDWVDKLLPFARSLAGSGTDSRAEQQIFTPNHSRFPGDPIGLRSQLTLTLMRETFLRAGARDGQRFKPDHWLCSTFGAGCDDVLAWEYRRERSGALRPSPRPPWFRGFEIAAMAPDLFDITYYSIDPQFYQTFVKRARSQIFSQGVVPRPDLGYRSGPGGNPEFNILAQVQNFSGLYDARANYIVRDPALLLTGWAPNQIANRQYDFEFPTDQFQNCPPPGFKREGRDIPGGCTTGGRVGYSVKIVNEEFLRGREAGVGGVGIKGPILNPPPQW